MKQRNQSLDTIRGFSVAMMFVFHFIFDLNYFNFTDIPLFDHQLYILWRYIIVSIFLLSVGISLVYAYKDYLNIIKFIKRLMLLGFSVILVTTVTYFVFPNSWIYFGILHLIWSCSIVCILFVRLPITAIIIAIFIILLSLIGLPDLSFLYNNFSKYLPDSSIDYYPIFPWISLVFMGIFLGHSTIFNNININIKPLSLLGRHALLLYLTHQIVLFGIVGIIYYLIV